MRLKERISRLKSDIPAVFIALKHKRTPRIAKLVAGITVVYALSPVDLIPDFIPVLGYLDDIIILPVLVALTIKLIPKEIFQECRDSSKGMWVNGKPKKWYYAVPMVAIWIIIFWIIVKAVF